MRIYLTAYDGIFNTYLFFFNYVHLGGKCMFFFKADIFKNDGQFYRLILMIDFFRNYKKFFLKQGENSAKNCSKFISEEKHKKYSPSSPIASSGYVELMVCFVELLSGVT